MFGRLAAQRDGDEVLRQDARRARSLDEYQDAAGKLEELTGRWELATMELEELSTEG